MNGARRSSSWAWSASALKWLLLGLLAAAGLWLVLLVHAAGQTLLGTVLLLVLCLGVWTYTWPRTQALRYLYPAVAAALVFVVFPMAYTVGMSFTNQSARNLTDQAGARAQLLAERRVETASQRAFHLVRQGSGWQLLLEPWPGESSTWGTASGLALQGAQVQPLALEPVPVERWESAARAPVSLAQRIDLLPALRQLELLAPDGQSLRMVTLSEVAVVQPLYAEAEGGGLRQIDSGEVFRPDERSGFFTSAQGRQLQPGFRVFVGLDHYARVFTEPKFREPFMGVFVWTVVFSAGTVLGAGALGLLLACLLNWEALRGRAVYRIVLFLPYAVPAFLSILVFKGLFNQNLGEINLILEGLFGIRPAWFSEPLLARGMLLFVNIWLGFPYMMVLCSGLIQAIPADLYEASAIAGANPWQNFRRITLPLILKPLTPLLISAFAFNFNNFVLISLLTGGRPDYLDSDVPAGTTDILVSYTWRIAFQDSGNQYGLAAAISTVVFLMVAAITLVQLRMTRAADEPSR